MGAKETGEGRRREAIGAQGNRETVGMTGKRELDNMLPSYTATRPNVTEGNRHKR